MRYLILLALCVGCTLPTEPDPATAQRTTGDIPGTITVIVCPDCPASTPTGPDKRRRAICPDNPWVRGHKLRCR